MSVIQTWLVVDELLVVYAAPKCTTEVMTLHRDGFSYKR